MVAIGPTAGRSEIDEGSSYPSALKGWWTVGVLTGLYAVSVLDRQVLNLLLDPIGRSLRINDFQLSLLSGFAFATFYATFGILFGWCVDRFARRSLIFGGVTAWSLATMGCGLARSFSQLALARFSVGAGEAALNPAAYSIISDSIPRARLSLAISVFTAGAMIGSFASKILAASLMAVIPADGLDLPLLGHQEPWRVVFIAVGLPGIVLALLTWTFPEPKRRQRLGGPVKTTFREAAGFMSNRLRFYGWYFLAASAALAANFAFSVWSPAFLMRAYGLSVTQAGFLMAPMMIVPQIAGLLTAGALADKLFMRGDREIHLKLIMAMGCLKAAILGVAMTAGLPLIPTVVMLGLATFFSGCTGAAAAVLQLVTPNQFRGQVSATYLFITSLLGMGLGPMIAGALTTFVFHDPQKVGWAIAVTFASLQPVVVLALWRALRGVRAAVDEAAEWAGR